MRREAAALVAALLLAACSSSEQPETASPSASASASTSRSFGVAAAPTPSPSPAAAATALQRIAPALVTVIAGKTVASGVVYARTGAIVTSAHVVGAAKTVQIGFADGSRTAGRVVASDPVADIAVVQADRANLPPASFATALPSTGSPVLVAGTGAGLESPVATGIVSGVGAQIPGAAKSGRPLVDLIQLDRPIPESNTGGALLDLDGTVLGLAVASQGTGFAIPAATVVKTADELVATGKARHPFLGVLPLTLTLALSQALDVGVHTGVLLPAVTANGPAAKAGIQARDVMTSFDGETVHSAEEYLDALRTVDPGQKVQIGISRGAAGRTVTVTVGELHR